jgi:TolB-like protein/tetratricopeptide (TPR) repeat protein
MNKPGQCRPDLPESASSSGRSPARLDSWKEIASYLGRSEKTVRRWEGTEGLPVHRLLHEKRSSVYAYRSELEAWRAERTTATKCESDLDGNGAKIGAEHTPAVPPESVDKSTNAPARRRKLWMSAYILAAVCVTGSLAGMHWSRFGYFVERGAGPGAIQSLAVLPLVNLSGDLEQEYLADGMTEQIVLELARVGLVRVISSPSAMHYKNSDKSPSTIARELNVDAMLEGSIARSGTRIRMTVQLVTPSSEHRFRPDVYEADARNMPDLPRHVARDIGSKLESRLGTRPAATPGSEKYPDPETYENYLRGRHFLAMRTAEAMKKAVGYFQQTLQSEPGYAPAYAGLAVAYDLLGTYEVLPSNESFPKAKQFASQALQLDNSLAEAYTARAMAASFWEFNWSAADQDFQRAIALDPNFALAHHWYGEHWISIGKAERAVAELKRARELDPLSLPINGTLGRVYRDAKQYDEAIRQCRKTLELDPHFAMGHWCLSQVYVGQQRYAAAIDELELANKLGTTPLVIRDLGWAYAASGNTAKAREILEALKHNGQSGGFSPYSVAAVHASLGEKDEAFRWLDKAYDERDSQITYLALDPELDPLRSDPRFPRLLERLHIPP